MRSPGTFLGIKLQTVDCPNGKLTPQDIENHLHYRGDEHRVQLKAVSITQPTEWGTLYSKEEIQALAHTCHQNGLWLHMDGARISNAAVALGLSFEAFTVQAGVDVLSLEVPRTESCSESCFWCLTPNSIAKSYFSQTIDSTAFQNAIYLCAVPALAPNGMVERAGSPCQSNGSTFSKGRVAVSRGSISSKTQVNGVFAYIPKEWNTPLMQHMPFYIFQPATNMARWMCAFDSQKEDIHRFLEQMKQLSKASDVFWSYDEVLFALLVLLFWSCTDADPKSYTFCLSQMQK